MRTPRVTDVERVVVDVPFRERCAPWNALLVGQFRVIEVVRVSTEDPDIVGYGETLPHFTWAHVTDEAIERVRGSSPAELLWDDSIGAGLQMALADIVGKALGVPVHRLLNLPKVRDWCPIAWWSTKMPPAVLAAEAQDAVAEGYLAHKFKARPWFDVYAQVEAISAVTPPEYLLDMDFNGFLLDVASATPVLSDLDQRERVGIYESPIPLDDFTGFRRLRDKIHHPIAEHFFPATFPTSIATDAVDGYVFAKAGLSGLLHQGVLAGAFNKSGWLQLVGTGLTTAMALHIGAVLSHAHWPYVTALNIYTDDLIAEPIIIRDGHAKVPDRPGLGVQLDEQAVEQLQMAPPYQVEYPRRILTFALPDGRRRHYTETRQLWRDCHAGNMPVQARGATLEVWPDDGSPEFADLHQHATRAPVPDYRA